MGAEGVRTKVSISQAKGQSWQLAIPLQNHAGSVFLFQGRRLFCFGGMSMILQWLTALDQWVWGPWLLILLVGTGVWLTVRLRFLQLCKLPEALRLILFARNKGKGDIDSFKALCTALAATVGTGNIVGVATAIKLGGPGALFWMWMAAFFGMATKYAEGCLAVKYRKIDNEGHIAGGPMYYIEMGLGKKWKPLAVIFAVFGVLVALLGSGTYTQVNAIISSLQVGFGFNPYITCAILTVLVGVITFGGLQSIAKASSRIVPSMAVLYLIVTIIYLIWNGSALPDAIESVFAGAFSGTAAMGGFAGAGVMLAMRAGIARGLFSNESGLGSAPIVAAAAKTKWPAEQGLISMTGTFIDTLVICTLTGLTIIVSGLWTTDINGAPLTQAAFATTYGAMAPIILTLCLTLFAFTTILGWNYYGERCCQYLFGTKSIRWYRALFILIIASGAFLQLEAIWALADIVNGLMAVPNLIALLGLTPVIVEETKKYFRHMDERNARLKAYKARKNGTENGK
jgi:AGCS family alanine or glycine:cation symporter